MLQPPPPPEASIEDLQKQLGKRRSEKARAERAVRKGRRAQLEITGGSEAVQAIMASLPAPGEQAAATAPPPLGAAGGPPREQHVRTPEGQQQIVLPPARPPGLATGETPPAAGSLELALACLLHPETLLAAGSTSSSSTG